MADKGDHVTISGKEYIITGFGVGDFIGDPRVVYLQEFGGIERTTIMENQLKIREGKE